MVKAQRKPTGRSKNAEAAFEIPTDLNGWMKLIFNNPGDSLACLACVFVGFYMLPQTSDFAANIVTIQHNVTDPAAVQERGTAF